MISNPTILSTGSEKLSCPFCANVFSRSGLGRHLHACKKRNGQDYEQYLIKGQSNTKSLGTEPNLRLQHATRRKSTAHTTNSEKVRRYTQRTCPVCGKSFKRLDVHLKSHTTKCSSEMLNNASREGHESNITTMSQGPHKDTDSCEPISDHCRTTPQNRLKLPTTEEDWLAADLFFASNTVPKVCCESSVDVANLLLVDDIYHYFQNTFGTTSNARCKRKQTPAASRRLSRLQQQKRGAQRALRHAKKKKISREEIFPLVKTWRNLIRVHNKTKRHMQRKSFKKQSRIQQIQDLLGIFSS